MNNFGRTLGYSSRQYYEFILIIKLQPAIFLCLNTSFVFKIYQPRQCYASYKRSSIVDWSSSGIMTSKLIIRESESPRPAASD